MLGLIVEVFIQILLEVIAELAFELGFGTIGHALRGERKSNPVLAYVGIALLAAVIGLAVSLVIPDRLLDHPPITGLSLILSPLAAGLLMSGFGRWREEQGHRTSRLATFRGGALFAFSFAGVRLIIIEGLIPIA